MNVTVTNPDGSVGIIPDGFTYGSNVLNLTPNSGPATGGTTVTVYGYGFDFDKSQVQVTVGGNPAVVTTVFGGPGISPFPFPMDQVKFTVPAGSPGPADIVITTPVGAATVAGGFHYLQNVQSFGIGSTLAEVVYDQSRQRLYATDYAANKVDVFDLTGNQILAPIPVGNSPNGLAITPDHTTLVVTNLAESTISIVSLTGSAGTKTVSLKNTPGLPALCGSPFPYAVATTSKKQAIIAITCSFVQESQFVVVDLATQSIGCGTSQGCAALVNGINSIGLALSASADGTKIFVADGYLGVWDVPSDTFSSQPFVSPGVPPPLSILGSVAATAADGTWFAQNFVTIDSSLYESSAMQDVDYLLSGIYTQHELIGEKLHPTGALLYVPQSDGVDIYDSHRGHIVRRIALPLTVSDTFDAMTLDETGSRLFLISSTGSRW